MKRTILLAICVSILTVLATQLALGIPLRQTPSAQIPEIISYQGLLNDNNGTPLTGNYDLTVRIYNQESAGSHLWEETHAGVPVNNGLFNVLLGSVNPLTVAFDEPYYMGLSINGADELTPRLPFTSVATAFRAKVANTVVELPDSDFDSGWFPMQSQQGVNSYKEISHDLGDYPSRVKVLVKAVDGANEGFIFEGIGSAQADDDVYEKHYGGLVFAYNQNKVRLWAPDRKNDSSKGGIISVFDGWGGEVNVQLSHSAEVRVLVWK